MFFEGARNEDSNAAGDLVFWIRPPRPEGALQAERMETAFGFPPPLANRGGEGGVGV